MFDNLVLRGGEAAVVWGYHTAAVCTSWVITQTGRGGVWALSATVKRADAFKLRQQQLKFTAPRKGGYWCWPIVACSVDGTQLTGTLGQPEQ